MINIQDLNDVERKLLYYYAVTNQESSDASLKNKFYHRFGLTATRVKQDYNNLISKGLIYAYYIWTPTVVLEEYRYLVIKDLIENGSKDLDFFKKLVQNQKSNKAYLDMLIYAFTNQTNKPYDTLDNKWFSILYFEDLEQVWVQKLLTLASPKKRLDIYFYRIWRSIICDEPLSDNVAEMIFSCPGLDAEQKAYLDSKKRQYYFFLNGEWNESAKLVTSDDHELLAIRYAYLGMYEESVKEFNAAFKLSNPNRELKNVPLGFYASIVYVLACTHVNTPQTLNKLDIFSRKNTSDYPFLGIAKALSFAPFTNDHSPDEYLLKVALKAMVQKGVLAINYNRMAALLMEHYFDKAIPDGYYQHVPKFAILRHEMSPFLNLPPEEQENLNRLYGNTPVLTSVHVKQSWEWAIEDILKNVDQKSTSSNTQATSRIIYVVEDKSDYVGIMQQSWLKSGRWGAPKAASLARMKENDLPGMDETDREVARQLRYSNYSGTIYEKLCMIAIAPLLAESDRVFLSKRGSLSKNIVIEKQKPYVELKKEGKKIEIATNFTKAELNKNYYQKCVVKKDAIDHYTVIPLDEIQKEIVSRLFSLGSFPLKAEEQVKNFLTRIDSVIEVRSSLISDKSIPTIEGSNAIAVKLKPFGTGQFDILFCVHPVDNFTQIVAPGEGRNLIYDTIEGKTVRIKRDLEGEVQTFNDVLDSLPTLRKEIKDEFAGMASTDAVLELLSYARDGNEKLIVEWSEGKSVALKTITPQANWQMSINATNEWFEIEGEVRLDENTVISMAQLLGFVGQNHGTRYIKLNDQDFLEIDKKLRRQLERLESVAVQNRNKLQISPYNVTLIDEKILADQFKAKVDKKLIEQKERINESLNYTPSIPATLNATLRPYQEDGFNWLARLSSWGAGGCLADDMGLGKTVQAIALLLHTASKGPSLVVAPASVIPNWASELAKFAPTLDVVILNHAEDRAKCITDAGVNQVVLTTYGLLNTESEHLADKEWSTICLDEAHTIKNKETKMSQAAMQLKGANRLILTGTPIQNHLGELWNLFRFINPGLLGSMETFRSKFVNPIHGGDKERLRELQRIISPFLLRRTKADVIEDLPDKTEIIRPIELADDELAVYETMRLRAAKAIGEAEKVDVNTLAEITRLRRAACNMSLIDRDWTGSNSKVDAFIDLVSNFNDGNNKMLVFSQFTSFLEIVRNALDKEKIPYLYLDGSTTMKQREELVKKFREGDCPLFLISLKAGGLGLNLPEANYVVHLDPWWNPAIEQQATDRAYRIGQKRNVTVYHLVAKNTIEEKILRLHRSKRDISDSLLEGSDIAGKLTIKDMLELVSQSKV